MNRTQILSNIQAMFNTAFQEDRLSVVGCDIDQILHPAERVHSVVQDAMKAAAAAHPLMPNFLVSIDRHYTYENTVEGTLTVTVEGSPVQLLTVCTSYIEHVDFEDEHEFELQVNAAEISDEALAKVCMALQQHMAAVSAILSAKKSATERVLADIEAQDEIRSVEAAAQKETRTQELNDLILAA